MLAKEEEGSALCAGETVAFQRVEGESGKGKSSVKKYEFQDNQGE